MVLIKTCSDSKRKTQLERLYKRTFYNPKDIVSICERIISQLGYGNTSIYLEEVHAILLRLGPNGCRYFYHRNYSEDSLAIAIITEILDYYNAKYNEDKLIFDYNVDKNIYVNLKTEINLYLKRYHWHKG